MASKIKLLLIFFVSFSSIIFSIEASKGSKSNITWWCNKTPHPEPCKHFIRRSHKHFRIKHLSELRTMMIRAAMDQAIAANKHVKRCKPNVQTQHQRAVWSDCLKLYGNTILQLNRTLQGLRRTRTGCTGFDAQTWLSTALTNIKTCQTGFLELNVSDFTRPVMSSNLSKLISNSLATNGVLLRVKNNTNSTSSVPSAYPSWLSGHERKLLQSPTLASSANLVVAKDGSGRFRTIQAAIDAAARRRGSGRLIIYVKRGVYRENIEVGINNNNIVLVGDGMNNTIITGSRSVGGGYTTYSSATAGIDGLHFMARDITFINTAGPLKGQAVALRSASDLSVFYRCAFLGYQDTLMVYAQRQFYKSCYIYGTIDFIFGNAAVVFQNCGIYVRRPLKGQANVITAQGRNDPYQNTGISVHNSRVLAAPDLKPVIRGFKTYLGRPWMQYSRVVFMRTYIDRLISPVGWSKWGNSNFALDTLYYGEYKNFGPGSYTQWRVRWGGFHVINNAVEASQFTVDRLIAGQTWLPATGVPFTLGI
ncbi:pectinesterase/pectinesterase inhibitor 33-like [Tripterygium wilfordii]|uniref:Pectinesterase n=1 Tax=Tripterygium wilfordii TaxID=458696 RepID=A0A7J7CAA3_TRIWF|nr:probable pectinesterase/pectinesterase inhibitor 60 [Tripterygium wilfordii]KAF5731078.1 pectinesterase/pectinesterase inhibitor 33-like [Tripterygium wilfordii]